MSQYASAQEFYDLSGLTRPQLEQGRQPIYPDTLDVFLRAASGLIDSSISIKYHGSVPLRAWDDSVRMATVALATLAMLPRLGLPPDDNKVFTDAGTTWQTWLKGIREGTVFLPGLTAMEVKVDYRAPAFSGVDDERAAGSCEKGSRCNFWGYK